MTAFPKPLNSALQLSNFRSRFASCPLSAKATVARKQATYAVELFQTNVNRELSLLAVILGLYVSQRPVGWSIPTVQVRESPVSGRGVFAAEEIDAETVIGRYPGVLRSAAEVILIPPRYEHACPAAIVSSHPLHERLPCGACDEMHLCHT